MEPSGLGPPWGQWRDLWLGHPGGCSPLRVWFSAERHARTGCGQRAGELEEFRPPVGADPGQGAGSSLVGARPPTHHCPCRTSVVRHYKVKREGPKYVIDMEKPVSVRPGPAMRGGGLCAPSTPALTETPIRLQFSCASLDSVVNYFVSHTNNALVPFLLDEDYEKVLGRCGLRELGGGGAIRASPAPSPAGHPGVNAQPPHLL